MTRVLVLAAAAALSGCAHPQHLQYDHGRAYMDALNAQADLGRPSVAGAEYHLTGFEGIQLRVRVTEEATDQESGEAEATKKFEVQ